MWVVILNGEQQEVHVLSLADWDATISVEEYLEEELDYSLDGCTFMVTHEKPTMTFLKK